MFLIGVAKSGAQSGGPHCHRGVGEQLRRGPSGRLCGCAFRQKQSWCSDLSLCTLIATFAELARKFIIIAPTSPGGVRTVGTRLPDSLALSQPRPYRDPSQSPLYMLETDPPSCGIHLETGEWGWLKLIGSYCDPSKSLVGCVVVPRTCS